MFLLCYLRANPALSSIVAQVCLVVPYSAHCGYLSEVVCSVGVTDIRESSEKNDILDILSVVEVVELVEVVGVAEVVQLVELLE